MRTKGLVALAVLATVAAAVPTLASAERPSATVHPAAVAVFPTVGSRHTRFVVRFRTPGTGSLGRATRRVDVSAEGPARAGCDSVTAASVALTGRGGGVTVALTPGAGGWCRGTYAGRIDEFLAPVCLRGRMCPEFVTILLNLGQFSFRVR